MEKLKLKKQQEPLKMVNIRTSPETIARWKKAKELTDMNMTQFIDMALAEFCCKVEGMVGKEQDK